MRQLTISLLISILPLFLFSQTSKNQISIGFYNVENLYDTINDPTINDDEFTPDGVKKWDTERYEKKLLNISKVISSINGNTIPDIFGFAEIENRQVLEDLIKSKSLVEKHYQIVHEDSPDKRGIDVGLIYNPDVFKYISHKKIPIPLETEYKVRDILYTKGVLGKDDTLHVFINHWKSRSGGQETTEPQRIQCALTLKHSADSILSINKNAKIVIMGDLNDEPKNKSVSEALQANNSDNAVLYDLMLPLSEAGLGTHFYRGNWTVLDHIIVSKSLMNSKKGFVVKDGKASIFSADWISYENKNGEKSPNRTYGGNNYYGGFSDHYPVFMVLEEKN